MPVNVKNLIAETFVKLSDEKNIDKITVKDIVEACGISRQAFYYHFRDLLEVIEWSMEQAFGQLLDRSLQEDDPEIVLNDFITASENAAPFMQKLFRSQKREQVERMGFYAQLYTYTGYKYELDMARLSSRWDVWLADYTGKTPNVTFNYNAHQHTSKGSVPGISGNVDLNVTTINYPKIIRKKGLTRLREGK